MRGCGTLRIYDIKGFLTPGKKFFRDLVHDPSTQVSTTALVRGCATLYIYDIKGFVTPVKKLVFSKQYSLDIYQYLTKAQTRQLSILTPKFCRILKYNSIQEYMEPRVQK